MLKCCPVLANAWRLWCGSEKIPTLDDFAPSMTTVMRRKDLGVREATTVYKKKQGIVWLMVGALQSAKFLMHGKGESSEKG